MSRNVVETNGLSSSFIRTHPDSVHSRQAAERQALKVQVKEFIEVRTMLAVATLKIFSFL